MIDGSTEVTDALDGIRVASDSLAVGHRGELVIEGCPARSLIETFGSPLYVISERTLRLNLRRVTTGLAARWPRATRVLYAIKANNNLAIRAIAYSEGAGGDCFGLGEIHATMSGGADPDKIVLNGSSKSDAELERAVEFGFTVNIDDAEEVGRLARLAEARGRRVRVNVRLKIHASTLNAYVSDFDGGASSMVDQVVPYQWGLSIPLAAQVVRDILDTPALELTGYHMHIGRTTNDPAFYGAWARIGAGRVAELRQETGFVPSVLDLGGGYARERDAESRSLARNPHEIEEYLDAVTDGLREGLTEAGIPLPDLWIEPGRYIAGNAGVLLGTVGSVKRDDGRVWVHVDCSINNLLRIDIAGYVHPALAADRLAEPLAETVDIVGPLCAGSPLGHSRPFPRVRRGDIVAFLDAGMYAETASNQFNGVPRPATVLVHDGVAEVIKERESVDDVFRQHRLPDRLRSGRVGADTLA